MIAVSVLLPFHNAESTLEAALDSLKYQKCGEEIEFILINDGSTDRSEEIVKYFFALNPGFEKRSVIINCPFRQGLAAATTLGINMARGEYLARLDADDTYPEGAISVLLSTALRVNADVVCGNIRNIYPDGKTKVRKPTGWFGDLNKMRLTTVNFSKCNKLVRKSLLTDNDIMPMPGIDCWEDVNIMSRLLALNVKTTVTDDITYNYSINENVASLSNTRHDLAMRQREMCALLVEKWFVERGLTRKYEKFILQLKFYAKIKLLRGAYCDVTKWKETFPEVNKNIMQITTLPLMLRTGIFILDRLPVKWTEAVCRTVDRFIKR